MPSSLPRTQRPSRLPRSQRRSLVERRRAAAAPLAGERKTRNHDAGKRTCSRQTKADAKRQEPRWKQDLKEDGEAIRRPSQMRRIEGHSRKKCQPGCMEMSTCGCVSEIAGATRSHAEVRGDLHGRKHAYTLRRSDDDLTRRAAAAPPGRWPGTPIIHLRTKSGRSDLPIVTPRTGLWILPATEIPPFAV